MAPREFSDFRGVFVINFTDSFMKPLLIAGVVMFFAGAAFAQSPPTPAPDAAAAPAAAAPGPNDKPYKVVDGNKVDEYTMKGFRTWRAGSCDRCHGPNQEGLVGPALVESLKVLSKADFMKTVHDGRLEKGMPSFAENPTVMDGLENLYAYLKGRSDGAITTAHVEPIQ